MIGFENGGKVDKSRAIWADPRNGKGKGMNSLLETPRKEHSPADTLI